MAGERYQDEEMADAAGEGRQSRIRSTVTAVRKQKGRGFRDDMDADDDRNNTQQYESLQGTGRASGAQKSVEGWVIFVSNLHEETSEEDLTEEFMEYGNVKNLYLNLDRRTGFVKGYALIEYDKKEEAQEAIDAKHGADFLEQPLSVTWCFSTGPNRKVRRGR